MREINGNQSPGSQQRNLLPQLSPGRPGQPRAAEPLLLPAALGPDPAKRWAPPPPSAPNPSPGQAKGRGPGPTGPQGDEMGRRGGENGAPRPTASLLSLPWRSGTAWFLLKKPRVPGSCRRGAACREERKEGGERAAASCARAPSRWFPSGLRDRRASGGRSSPSPRGGSEVTVPAGSERSLEEGSGMPRTSLRVP